MEQKEQWMEIEDYPDYSVSSFGNVFSSKSNKQLKIQKCTNKYLFVGLCNNGKVKQFRVHRLVACTFLKKPLNTSLCVCHKDDNPRNNNIDNLFFGTQKENLMDMYKKGRGPIHDHNGEKNPGSKLNIDDVKKIRKMGDLGIMPNTKIAKIYGVGSTCIDKIIKRLNWKNIPD